MSVQSRSQSGHSVQLCRVTAPKDGYGAKQEDSTGSETILLLSLSAFPVPQHHRILEKGFLLAVTNM